MEKMPHGSVFGGSDGPRRLTGRTPARRYAAIGLVLAGLGLAAGCDHPLACERMAKRQRSLEWTANTLAWREQQAPERLRRDCEFIRKDEEKRREMFARDLRQIQERFDYDVQRWQERQCEYVRKLEEILRGKPENLERNAIILFY